MFGASAEKRKKCDIPKRFVVYLKSLQSVNATVHRLQEARNEKDYR